MKATHDGRETPQLVWVTGSQDMGCSGGIPDPWLVDDMFICAPVYNITQADIDAGAVTNNVRWVLLFVYNADGTYVDG